MYLFRSLLFCCLLPLLSSCGTGGEQPLEYKAARVVSDAVADALVKGDTHKLYSLLDVGFQTVVKNETEFKSQMVKMDAQFGQPVEFEYKHTQVGRRVDGVWNRPSRVFWYAVKTTKYPKGKYFLKVEIVPSGIGGRGMDTSGFGLLTFDKKVPSFLQ